ncbi:MAG: TolC family protein [bacterium]
MKKIIFIILFMCFLGVEHTSSQDVLTFHKAVKLAFENNHQIKVAYNNKLIAENNAHPGNAGLLPDLNITGNINQQNTSGLSMGSDGTISNLSAKMQASYTLFDGFGNIYRLKKLNKESEISTYNTRSLIEQTLLRVSSAYYNLASAEENLRISRELLSISRERLDRIKKRSQFGQSSKVQVLAAQVDFNNDSITVVIVQLRFEEAKRNLNALLNLEIDTDYTVDPEIEFTNIPELSELKQTARENNAAYQSAKTALKKAQLNKSIISSFQFPQIDLSASYGYTGTGSDIKDAYQDPNKSWTIGASLMFPLFNGFQTQIQRQNAEIGIKNSKLQKNEQELTLKKELINSFEAYKNSRKILELNQQNLQAAQLNFKRTAELFYLGQVTNTQFREAQLNLIRAKNSITEAKYTAKLDELVLLQITGQLISFVEE